MQAIISEVEMVKVIEATANPFRGIIPNPAALPEDPEEFRWLLHHSLSVWRNEGYLVVWLEVPITRAGLIPVAVDAGFSFHHAGQGYLMLTYPLVEGAFIPPYATHYIGVGGVVLNDRQELLVVSEKLGRATRGPSYKLPGGAVQEGEHLIDAAIREVLEETGVRTVFDSLVCFRHWHGYRYGKSDIYFVCRMRPLSRDITMQADEIEECLWMPVEEYLRADTVATFNKRIVQAALDCQGIVPAWIEGYNDPDKREFFMPENLLAHLPPLPEQLASRCNHIHGAF